MTSTAQEETSTAKAGKDSGYIVLERVESSGHWASRGTYPTANAGAAITQHAKKSVTDDPKLRMFVAVPVRSFKPVIVSAKTETRLIVEDAS